MDNASDHWTEMAMVGWVQGFLSGLSMREVELGFDIDPIDYHSIVAWLDNHCRAHPLDNLWVSSLRLDEDLQRKSVGLATKG
jgi:hypothetical protein